MRSILVLILLAVLAPIHAHVGTKLVYFEGDSGSYRVRVSIRPPEVVPGLAQINVRVLKGDVTQIGVLPVKWDAGRVGAPPPDLCTAVPGETNLYTAQLWFMDMGAYSVFVDLDGKAGKATAIVPLNSISTRRLGMPRWMATLFTVTGGLLIILLVTIINTAVRDGVLAQGIGPDKTRRRLGYLAMVVAAVVLTSALARGKVWWDKVDREFRNERLFKPLQVQAQIKDQRVELDLASIRHDMRDRTVLVADHGKLMHLFLVHKTSGALAHLHPQRLKDDLFAAELTALPAGTYTLFADITHESGLTQTLLSEIEIPTSLPSRTLSDPDDSTWLTNAGPALSTAAQVTVPLAGALSVNWLEPAGLVADGEAVLRFEVLAGDGRPAPIEPYLGMWAHLIIVSEDHQVFTHLHPGGTVSMAAQDLFAQRERQRSGKQSLDVICGRPERELVFPYSFPKAGRYRMYLQTRALGQIITAAFEVTVVGNHG